MELREKNKHLYSRAAFGISPEDYDHPLPIEEAVAKLFPKDPPAPLIVITDEEWAQFGPKAMLKIDPDSRRKKVEKFLERMKEINHMWFGEMVSTQYPLLEKMTLFWSGHFATRLDNPYYDQKMLNIFRKNALGNFRDMLCQVSKNEIMVGFLNNKQNIKDHPNENFSREVMELFTLGRDNYTEHDVREGGRAFTGWSLDNNGAFVIKDEVHDDGQKQFLGKSGKFNGDDILDILLKEKQTALFITKKLYQFFVSDEHLNEDRVATLADHFYNSNYDISGLLKEIFTADWFYGEDVKGAKVKSPIELLVGYQRMLPMEFDDETTIIQIQRTLGQHLLNPPNVAGWPGGRFWINSSSLTLRMKLPEALFFSKELNPELEKSLSASRAMSVTFQTEESLRIGKVVVNWSKYLAYWKRYSMEQLPATLADFLLQIPVPGDQMKKVVENADRSSNEEYIKSLTMLLMQLPEFQLT